MNITKTHFTNINVQGIFKAIIMFFVLFTRLVHAEYTLYYDDTLLSLQTVEIDNEVKAIGSEANLGMGFFIRGDKVVVKKKYKPNMYCDFMKKGSADEKKYKIETYDTKLSKNNLLSLLLFNLDLKGQPTIFVLPDDIVFFDKVTAIVNANVNLVKAVPLSSCLMLSLDRGKGQKNKEEKNDEENKDEVTEKNEEAEVKEEIKEEVNGEEDKIVIDENDYKLIVIDLNYYLYKQRNLIFNKKVEMKVENIVLEEIETQIIMDIEKKLNIKENDNIKDKLEELKTLLVEKHVRFIPYAIEAEEEKEYKVTVDIYNLFHEISRKVKNNGYKHNEIELKFFVDDVKNNFLVLEGIDFDLTKIINKLKNYVLDKEEEMKKLEDEISTLLQQSNNDKETGENEPKLSIGYYGKLYKIVPLSAFKASKFLSQGKQLYSRDVLAGGCKHHYLKIDDNKSVVVDKNEYTKKDKNLKDFLMERTNRMKIKDLLERGDEMEYLTKKDKEKYNRKLEEIRKIYNKIYGIECNDELEEGEKKDENDKQVSSFKKFKDFISFYDSKLVINNRRRIGIEGRQDSVDQLIECINEMKAKKDKDIIEKMNKDIEETENWYNQNKDNMDLLKDVFLEKRIDLESTYKAYKRNKERLEAMKKAEEEKAKKKEEKETKKKVEEEGAKKNEEKETEKKTEEENTDKELQNKNEEADKKDEEKNEENALPSEPSKELEETGNDDKSVDEKTEEQPESGKSHFIKFDDLKDGKYGNIFDQLKEKLQGMTFNIGEDGKPKLEAKESVNDQKIEENEREVKDL